jgi:hypothetical protein
MEPPQLDARVYRRAGSSVLALTGGEGALEIRNVPPGDYAIEAWQETFGTQDQQITVGPSGAVATNFVFKGE